MAMRNRPLPPGRRGGGPGHGVPWVLRGAAAAFVLGTAAPAYAQACYVDHVGRTSQGLELRFTPDKDLSVRVSKIGRGIAATDRLYSEEGDQMHRLRPDAWAPDAAAVTVVLSGDEQAYVMVVYNPHVHCTVTPAVRGGVRGVVTEERIALPGIPAATDARFVPAEDGIGAGR